MSSQRRAPRLVRRPARTAVGLLARVSASLVGIGAAGAQTSPPSTANTQPGATAAPPPAAPSPPTTTPTAPPGPAPNAAVQEKRQRGYLVRDPAAYDRAKQDAAARAGQGSQQTNAAQQPNGAVVSPTWQGVNDPNVAPSDSTGAIGTGRYVELVNVQYAIYDRLGTTLSSGGLDSLTGDTDPASFLTDPQVIWDPDTSRFYFVVLDVNTDTFDYGFSKTATPSSPSDWCQYVHVDFGYTAANELPDFPKLGDTSDFVLVGANVFDNATSGFVRSDVDWITKPPAGTSCSASLHTGLQTNLKHANNNQAFTPVPANQTDGSGNGWIIDTDFVNPTRISLFTVASDGGNPPSAVIQQTAGATATIPTWSVPANAPQSGGTATLDTLDGRFTQAVSAIDPAHSSSTAIWAQHSVFGGAGSQVRWYEINPGSANLFQSSNVSDPSLYAFNAAIAPDRVVNGAITAFGDSMAIGFSTSSSTTFPAIQSVTKIGTGLQSTFVPIKASTSRFFQTFACPNPSPCRWGDYSGATPDPGASPTGPHGAVYLTNAWAASDNNWRTWNWALTLQDGGFYTAVTPARILDTRNGTGGFNQPLGAGGSLNLTATGVGGVPASGVSAVVLNVTVTDTTAPSFLTVWPTGQPRPTASNLNWTAGVTIPNLVQVHVGTGGKVSIFNFAGSTNVVADVVGWYSEGPSTGAGYTPLTPARILDTRNGTGGFNQPLGPGASLDLTATGVGGVPASGVSAVVLNVTVTDTTAPSFLTVWPTGQPRPTASNLNWTAGVTIPNLVVVKVGTGGKVSIFNNNGSTDVLADVVGWYSLDSSTGSGSTSLQPARILDTRNGTGGFSSPLGPGGSLDLTVTGVGAVPATGVTAVVLNVTVTNTTAGSFLTVWPSGQPRPTASNLNWTAGVTIPNLVVVKVGTGGKVSIFNFAGSTDVVADVVGWF
jgi:hypothetical protein